MMQRVAYVASLILKHLHIYSTYIEEDFWYI